MQLLAWSEAERWVGARGITCRGDPDYHYLDPSGFHRKQFEIPSDAGRRVALAKLLWYQFGAPEPEFLVWVALTGVWPSGEHRPMFSRWRKALVSQDDESWHPGMLFRMGEEPDAISAVAWPLLFLWDAYLVPGSGRTVVELSHDEWGAIATRRPQDLDRAAEAFDSFGLELTAE